MNSLFRAFSLDRYGIMIFMVWFIGAICVVQVLTLTILWFFSRGLINRITSYEEVINDLFKQEGDKPSKFASLVDSISAVLASRLITSFKANIRGSAGGEASAESKAEQAQLLATNPLLGLFGGGKLGKSPLALGLLSLLGSKLGTSQNNNGSMSTVAPKFKL